MAGGSKEELAAELRRQICAAHEACAELRQRIQQAHEAYRELADKDPGFRATLEDQRAEARKAIQDFRQLPDGVD